MQIFKFGGASVKNAEGIKNLLHILKLNGTTEKVIVISAMGKMTNAFEEVVDFYFDKQEVYLEKIKEIQAYHQEICVELFPENHLIFQKIESFITEIKTFLSANNSDHYDFVYDQIVSFGELLSTTIVSEYLKENNIKNTWLDARKLIKTDSVFRDAKVDWKITENNINTIVNPKELSLTQGFITSDLVGNTTTLGREGSDYSAGILAYCLNAEKVCIWKNVEGVLNADPQEFSDTELLKQISYQEAIELAFYGASVIHPKMLQPLQRKKIPLFVKSFYHPENEGTSVCEGQEIIPKIPCYIVKKDLILLSISTRDFSFFVEENISEVFALFHQYQTKVHLIQNSAISFSVCIDNKFRNAAVLIEYLQQKFQVSYNRNVNLYTIRHFDQKAIERIRKNRSVLLEQRTRGTIQFVTKEK